MITLILAILNFIFIKNNIISLIVSLGIFIYVEFKRRDDMANPLNIIAELLSAIDLARFLLLLIMWLLSHTI